MKTASPMLKKIKDLIECSEIFDISKELDPVKYRNLEYELVLHLYEYAQCLSNSRYRDMGLEIVETATECLRSYDKNRGPFTNYFSASLARRVNKEQAIRHATETRGGIALPEKVQKQITDIQLIAGKMMRDVDDDTVIEAAAHYLEIPTQRVRELVKLNDQYVVIHDNADDEETASVFSFISDAFVLEDAILEKASMNEIFDAVEICFEQCRHSQQEVVSKLLTLRLLACPPGIIQIALHRSFFDQTMYDLYVETGKIQTARDISDQLNKNEASTSRTFSNFGKKVKEYMSELHSKE